MTKRWLAAGLTALAIFLGATAAIAATADYRYDALGRLTNVTYSDGKYVSYVYDAAGNRTQVVSGTMAGVPSSITVPVSSSTGAYIVSWGSATGPVTSYELYEATNPSFSGQTRVYNGTGSSIALSGRGSGTYYYRARACFISACGAYTTAANGVTVSIPVPPGVPSSITVPTSSTTGSYTISWGSATGPVTAYELYEATNPSFSGESRAYIGMALSAALSGRGSGTYYYRVRACTAVECSADRTGSNAVTVTLPTAPGTPSSIAVPASSTTGSYAISWGAASGTVTSYELYEAASSSFTGQTIVYNGTAVSASLSGRANGTYYYRARACNSVGCSAYVTGSNAMTVTLPTAPGAPSSIAVPSSSTTGSYTVSWGAASGTVTSYELYEATNSSFSGQAVVYSGTALSAALSGRGSGTYYYRARACNSVGCSAYVAGANAVTVSIPVPIQVLNPAISVGATGQLTQITTLANLNGNTATINSFTVTCTKASAAIQSGAQSVRWTNTNTFIRTCEVGTSEQCTASYAIRNSSSGQLHSGTSAITVLAQGQNLGAGQSCP